MHVQGGYCDCASGVSGSGYVTYMDEEKISVVVRHSFYEEKTTVPRVEAVTLRVDTGEVISHEEMVHADEASAWQFCSRSSHQNGTVEFVDDLSRYSLGEKEHSGKRGMWRFFTRLPRNWKRCCKSQRSSREHI